jgi:ubiquinone/menaquinone biosynthesis C-methylase UbiE
MRPSTDIIIKSIKRMNNGSNILDVGCGTGRELKRILLECPHVNFYAIDTEDVGRFLPTNINFKIGSFQDIKSLFPGTKFDGLICQHVLEHIVYPTEAFHVFTDILNIKGKIFVESPSWIRLAIPFHRDYFWNDPTHIRPYTKKSLKSLCSQFNFNPVIIRLMSATKIKMAVLNLKKSSNIQEFIKRFLDALVSPFLNENIILVAEKKENEKTR